MRGASKPKGSVEDGIERIKEFEQIVVHPRCRHTIAELGSYSYKKDRVTGDILPVVEKRDDHCLDAVRYSHYSRVKRWVMV
jgi:phage terminase large subunit